MTEMKEKFKEDFDFAKALGDMLCDLCNEEGNLSEDEKIYYSPDWLDDNSNS